MVLMGGEDRGMDPTGPTRNMGRRLRLHPNQQRLYFGEWKKRRKEMGMERIVKILGLAGSLRKTSYNFGLEQPSVWGGLKGGPECK
jgi:hypothetical protein